VSELSTIPACRELATEETSLNWGIECAPRLADEGPGTTIVSVTAIMVEANSGRQIAAAIVGEPTVEDGQSVNSLVVVTVNGAPLQVNGAYRLVVVYTSSLGNTQAVPVTVLVPF
jgi:hypothetical protein